MFDFKLAVVVAIFSSLSLVSSQTINQNTSPFQSTNLFSGFPSNNGFSLQSPGPTLFPGSSMGIGSTKVQHSPFNTLLNPSGQTQTAFSFGQPKTLKPFVPQTPFNSLQQRTQQFPSGFQPYPGVITTNVPMMPNTRPNSGLQTPFRSVGTQLTNPGTMPINTNFPTYSTRSNMGFVPSVNTLTASPQVTANRGQPAPPPLFRPNLLPSLPTVGPLPLAGSFNVNPTIPPRTQGFQSQPSQFTGPLVQQRSSGAPQPAACARPAGSLRRSKRGLFKGQPEYEYIKNCLAVVDSHQGLQGKPQSYQTNFVNHVANEQQKQGKNYKGTIDWAAIPGWSNPNYGAAMQSLNTMTENSYRQGDANTQKLGQQAMGSIQNVVNERQRQMNKYPNPDRGHSITFNNWQNQQNNWNQKFPSFVPAPPPAVPVPPKTPVTGNNNNGNKNKNNNRNNNVRNRPPGG